MPDNLRTGVERGDLYDPKINRSYAELAAHYDTLIDPAQDVQALDASNGITRARLAMVYGWYRLAHYNRARPHRGLGLDLPVGGEHPVQLPFS